ncbi:MAG: hypothetical protein IT374_22575 [Polyangiaceae bacterium]|nr:hypothetical protein [Polyangiaceae bacterium]
MVQEVVHAQKIAMLGYGPDVRDEAIRLRAAGMSVTVAVRHGGMSWLRALGDGFRPVSHEDAVEGADAVVVKIPERELPALFAQSVAPVIRPGALVVFAKASPVLAEIVALPEQVDVALVVTARGTGRVAVHQDATGSALARATRYAELATGAARIVTTTFADCMGEELARLVAEAGGVEQAIARCDRVLESPGHEPDEAVLVYYEHLRQELRQGRAPSSRQSGLFVTEPPSKRGAA